MPAATGMLARPLRRKRSRGVMPISSRDAHRAIGSHAASVMSCVRRDSKRIATRPTRMRARMTVAPISQPRRASSARKRRRARPRGGGRRLARRRGRRRDARSACLVSPSAGGGHGARRRRRRVDRLGHRRSRSRLAPIVNSGSCHFGSANDAIGRNSALVSASVQTRCRSAADACRSTIEAAAAASRMTRGLRDRVGQRQPGQSDFGDGHHYAPVRRARSMSWASRSSS